MQRLEKIQLKYHKKKPNPTGPSNVNSHNPTMSGDPRSLQTQLAQRPSDEWISVNLNKPPYYTPVDVLDINMNVWEDWHRLSDGDKDYYCNPRTDHLTQNVTHWRKRPGITYEPYNPMTTNDIPIMNINELNDMIKVMIKLIDKRTSSHLPHIEYVTGVDDAIIAVEQTFKQILKAKRMTGK